MEQFYENKSLSFREKKNKVGRFFLYLGVFISVAMTFFIMFLLIINSVGISPSDQYGFKLVRNDIGKEIINSYKIDETKTQLDKGEFNILKDEKNIYHVKFEKTETTRDLTFKDETKEIRLSIDIENENITFESSLDVESITIEEGLKMYDDILQSYFDKYAFYNSSFYKDLYNKEEIRYFYNEEKKLLKTGINNSNFVISNSRGIISKGKLELETTENKVEMYSFSFKK